MKKFHQCTQNVTETYNIKTLNILCKYILIFSCILYVGCYSDMDNIPKKQKNEYILIVKRYKNKDKKIKTRRIELTKEECHDFLKLIKKFKDKYVEEPAPQMAMDGVGEVNITSYGSIRILFDDSFKSIHVPGKKADKETKHKLYQLMDKIDNRLF